MTNSVIRTGSILVLATAFTIGLTFATVELPSAVDEVLQHTILTPGGDSHGDFVTRLKTVALYCPLGFFR